LVSVSDPAAGRHWKGEAKGGKHRALALLALVGIAIAAGTAGQLDTSFGTNGVAIEDAHDDMRARAAGLQSDGKIVAVGRDSRAPGDGTAAAIPGWKARRFHTDGSLDTTFGTNGVVTLFDEYEDWRENQPMAVAVDANDRIVISGRSYTPGGGKGKGKSTLVGRVTVARLLANGALDPAFGGGAGFVRTDVNHNSGGPFGSSVLIDGSGRIVVGGIAPVEVTIEVQGKGKKPRTQTVTRLRPLLIRYDASGNLDTSFGAGGLMIDDDPLNGPDTDERIGWHGIALQSDGSIVATIETNGAGYLARRYSTTGVRDSGFGIAGASTTRVWAIAVDSQDRIAIAYTDLAAGYDEAAIARYTASGGLDTGFGAGGHRAIYLDTSGDIIINSLAIASGDRLVGAGGLFDTVPSMDSYDTVLVRLDASGGLDATFGTGGYSDSTTPSDRSTNQDYPAQLLIDGNGRYVTAGHHRVPADDTMHWMLARWHGN
jgi:uncharacterized delta-60 repeat protein